jgi:xanthine dehydrogenase molybdopterin-binding subunit B
LELKASSFVLSFCASPNIYVVCFIDCGAQELKVTSGYDTRLAAVEAFNAASPWRKRGMSLMPMM